MILLAVYPALSLEFLLSFFRIKDKLNERIFAYRREAYRCLRKMHVKLEKNKRERNDE